MLPTAIWRMPPSFFLRAVKSAIVSTCKNNYYTRSSHTFESINIALYFTQFYICMYIYTPKQRNMILFPSYYFEMRRLASIRRFLTSTATATLVSAFVLSRIDYCSSLLFGSTHDVTSHLQRIQNYAARVILCLPKSSSITTQLKSLH